MDKMIIYTHSSEILFPSLTGVIRFLIYDSITGGTVEMVYLSFRPLQGLFVF